MAAERLGSAGSGAFALSAALLCATLGCRDRSAQPAELAQFDSGAAQASAKQAAAAALLDCHQRSGPAVSGHVELRFAASGIVSRARVQPEELAGSARGACIERVFRFDATVPPFRGGPGSVQQEIDAPPARLNAAAYPRVEPTASSAGDGLDRAAAGLGLFRAARQASEQCPAVAGGPTGNGKVRVRFGNDGKVQGVELLNARFHDTPAGECVQRWFAAVSIPPFRGSGATMLKAFHLGDGPGPAPSFDHEAAAQALASNPPPFDTAVAARALSEAALAAAACRKRDAWGSGEVRVGFLNIGLADDVELLTRHFEGTATGECVANAFRAAHVPVFSGLSPASVQGFQVLPALSFDEVRASEALQDAARTAAACGSEGGPKGQLEVGVRFGPDGHVAHATVMTEVFVDSLPASCVKMVLRRVQVEAFDGPAPPLFQSLELR